MSEEPKKLDEPVEPAVPVDEKTGRRPNKLTREYLEKLANLTDKEEVRSTVKLLTMIVDSYCMDIGTPTAMTVADQYSKLFVEFTKELEK